VLLNVLHLDGPTPNEPQILEVAPSVFNGKKGVGGIISLFTDWPNLLDLTAGNDVIVERQGTGKEGTSYGVTAVPRSTKIDPKVLERLHDLDKFVAAEMTEAAAKRALAQVATLSGLLPAPTTGVGGDAPSATTVSLPAPTPAATIAAPVAAPVAAPAPAAVAAPAPAVVTQVAAAPAPVAAAAPAANTAVPATGDAELDALLADLGPK
jgi:hypothetical protein